MEAAHFSLQPGVAFAGSASFQGAQGLGACETAPGIAGMSACALSGLCASVWVWKFQAFSSLKEVRFVLAVRVAQHFFMLPARGLCPNSISEKHIAGPGCTP